MLLYLKYNAKHNVYIINYEILLILSERYTKIYTFSLFVFIARKFKSIYCISGELLSLNEAIAQHVIDPTAGCFIDLKTGKDISLSEALNKSLLKKPTSLHGALVKGLLDEEGIIKDPKSGKKLSLLDAIKQGILDTDMKCILDPRTEEMLSLAEALERGLISPTGEFVDPTSGRRLSIQDAVNEGLTQLLSEDVTVLSKSVSNTALHRKESVPEALQSGVLDVNSGLYVDKQSGRKMSVDVATKRGLIDNKEGGNLSGGSGLFDAMGNELSVIEAIRQQRFDPVTGEITDPTSGKSISLEDAIASGVIDPVNAQKIMELTSPLVQTTTITTNILLESINSSEKQDDRENSPVTIEAAVQEGLFNEKDQVFTDPKTGKNIPIEEAINKGMLKLSSEWPNENENLNKLSYPKRGRTYESSVEENGDNTRTFVEETQYHTEKVEGANRSVTMHKSSLTEKSDTKDSTIFSDVSFPMTIDNAIVLQILDPSTGIVLIPNENKTVNLHDAIKTKLLLPESAKFVDPTSKLSCDLQTAIDRKVLSRTGHYKQSYGNILNLRELIEKDIVILEDKQPIIVDTKRMLLNCITDPRTGEILEPNEAIAKGLLNLEKGTYTDPTTGEEMSIGEAVEKGFIGSDSTSEDAYVSTFTVKETKTSTITGALNPVTNKVVDEAMAIRLGIIDPVNKLYNGIDKDGNKFTMSLSEAIKLGFVIADEKTSRPEANNSSMNISPFTKETKKLTIKGVIDPETGNVIKVSEAIRRGILDEQQGVYINSKTGERLLLTEAVNCGMIVADVSTTVQQTSEVLDEKITSSRQTTMTLHSVVDPVSGKTLPGREAIDAGLLNETSGEYKDPRTGELMSIDEAIAKGFVKVEMGRPLEADRSERIASIHIDDLLDAQEAMTVEDVKEETKRYQIAGVKDARTGQVIDFNDALLCGIVDEDNGTYTDPQTGETISISEALSKGLIVGELATKPDEREVFKSSLVASKIPSDKKIKSVFNQMQNSYISPSVALQLKLIDQDQTLYYDQTSDRHIDINEAIEKDLVRLEYRINGSSHEITPNLIKPVHDEDDIVTVTVQSTKKSNSSSIRPLEGLPLESIQKAIELGFYNPETGMFKDPITGENLSLQQAIESGLIKAGKYIN